MGAETPLTYTEHLGEGPCDHKGHDILPCAGANHAGKHTHTRAHAHTVCSTSLPGGERRADTHTKAAAYTQGRS